MSPADLVPPQYRALALAGVAAGLLAAGMGLGWAVNGWRLGTAVADAQRVAAEDKAKAVGAALAQVKTAQAERDRLAAALATSDKTHSDNLQRLTDENNRLRAGAAAGTVRVRVAGAVCPERAADVPQAAAGSGVDSGTGAELGPQARQDFFDLRAAAIRGAEKLAACQDALGRITGQR